MAAGKKFKPFPKVLNPATGKQHTDVQKLKEQYLSGPDMAFMAFCKREGYNPKPARSSRGQMHWASEVDFDQWKGEWLRKQCDIQDEEVVPSLLDARKLVSKSRANFILDWNTRAQTMKKMLDYLMNVHIDDMRYDITHTLEIQAGKRQRKCRLDIDEMATMAGTAQRLLDLEAKALMLIPVQFKQVEKIDDQQDEPVPEFEIHTMGQVGMRGSEITKLMATYFDQYEKPKEIEVKSDEDSSQDQG